MIDETKIDGIYPGWYCMNRPKPRIIQYIVAAIIAAPILILGYGVVMIILPIPMLPVFLWALPPEEVTQGIWIGRYIHLGFWALCTTLTVGIMLGMMKDERLGVREALGRMFN
jgi:hypothetical protein